MTTKSSKSDAVSSHRCPTRLIVDAPADKDAFGPHERIATVIAEMIATEDGGQSIGIAGPWGAGKSTVLQLLAEILRDDEYVFWTFDAWSHEGDPLRRTFLEDLVSALKRRGWLKGEKSKYWDRRLEELAKRRKVTTTRNYPRFSKFGLLISAATILAVPVGTSLFSDGLSDDATIIPSWPIGLGDIHLQTFLGFILVMSPLLIYGGRWLQLKLQKQKRKRMVEEGEDGIKEKEEEKALSRDLGLFVQASVSDYRSEMTESPDPTSIEFEGMFSELVKDALDKPERKLVIAIDNLDRISPTDALSLWSTLQTFLRYDVREEWIKRLWVLLPYDPVSIRRLWENSEPQESELAASFLDKTFQTRFDVPRPLLSDWRTYLLKTLRFALPDRDAHDEEQLHIVYRLMAQRWEGEASAPTPREIKIVVNQIGAIHRQRCPEIPLPHLAYYALLQRDVHRDKKTADCIVKQLLEEKLPDDKAIGLLGGSAQDIRDHLAALAFGVDIRRARQLLLERPVINALTSPDPEELAELKSVSDGFFAVVEHVLERSTEEWLTGESNNLLHTIVALERSGLLDSEPAYLAESLVNQVARRARRVETWQPLTEYTHEGIITFAKRVQDARFRERIFTAYAAAIAEDPSEQTEERISRNVGKVIEVVSAFRDLGDDHAYGGGVTVPGGMDAFYTAMNQVLFETSLAEPELCWVFRPSVSADDAQSHLIRIIAEGRFRLPHYLAVRAIKFNYAETDWTPLVEHLRDRLYVQSVLDSEEVFALLQTLHALRQTVPAEAVLDVLARRGHLAHHFQAAATEGDTRCMAYLLFTFMEQDPKISEPEAAIGQAQQGYRTIIQHLRSPSDDFAKQLAFFLGKQGKRDLILRLRDHQRRSAPLVGKTLAIFAEEPGAHEFFSAELIAKRWDFLASRLQEDTFDRLLTNATDLPDLLTSRSFKPKEAQGSATNLV